MNWFAEEVKSPLEEIHDNGPVEGSIEDIVPELADELATSAKRANEVAWACLMSTGATDES